MMRVQLSKLALPAMCCALPPAAICATYYDICQRLLAVKAAEKKSKEAGNKILVTGGYMVSVPSGQSVFSLETKLNSENRFRIQQCRTLDL